MAVKRIVANDYFYSLVEGGETVLIPGGEYKLPIGEANELIDRGLCYELPKKQNKKADTRPPKINYADDSERDSDRSERVSKSRSERRRQSNKRNDSKQRKSSKKLSKSKSKK